MVQNLNQALMERKHFLCGSAASNHIDGLRGALLVCQVKRESW
jgi:hypothetical protein